VGATELWNWSVRFDQLALACVAKGVLRQTVLPTSSATRTAPTPSIATPTGRPRVGNDGLDD
jgi:hypothetical protein